MFHCGFNYVWTQARVFDGLTDLSRKPLQGVSALTVQWYCTVIAADLVEALMPAACGVADVELSTVEL